jgi:tRNA pseudouridine55 synthase
VAAGKAKSFKKQSINIMNKPGKKELQEGAVILVDKPYRWTSFDVVHKLRKPVQAKIGHAGTLDPLATGLLICCTGPFTKKISDYQRLPKEYTGIIHLGATTPTYDLESEPVDFRDYSDLTDDMLIRATGQFTGDIAQVPPAHSAIKKDGQRAYDLARAGKEVQLEARQITISSFELTKIALPEVHFRVTCSTGTYIRSLAHDFGQALGCGAYLQELRRTRIGDYHVDDALQPAAWIEWLKGEEV